MKKLISLVLVSLMLISLPCQAANWKKILGIAFVAVGTYYIVDGLQIVTRENNRKNYSQKLVSEGYTKQIITPEHWVHKKTGEISYKAPKGKAYGWHKNRIYHPPENKSIITPAVYKLEISKTYSKEHKSELEVVCGIFGVYFGGCIYHNECRNNKIRVGSAINNSYVGLQLIKSF